MAEKWKPQPIEVYKSWVDAILNEAEEKLTDWERNFVDGIEGMILLGGKLSQTQAEVLEKIYAEKTK